MSTHKYYAVIEKEEDYFSVSFPDLENCFTDAESLSDAVIEAQDVLLAMLSSMDEDGDTIPTPRKAKDIDLPDGASLVLITVNL